jgi:hypothetical protein
MKHAIATNVSTRKTLPHPVAPCRNNRGPMSQLEAIPAAKGQATIGKDGFAFPAFTKPRNDE